MRTLLATSMLFLSASASAQTCNVDQLAGNPLQCGDAWNILGPGADDNMSYPCSSTTYPGLDNSFYFDPPNGQRATVTIDASSNKDDYDLFALQNDNCGSGATCVDSGQTSENGGSETVSFISDGNGYWINVDELKDLNSGGKSYTIRATCTDDEECAPGDVVTEITCSTDITSTTVGGTVELNYYTCGTPFAPLNQTNEEAIYTFSPQADGSVTFTLDNLTADHDLYVLEDSCNPASCIEGATAASTSTDSVTFNAQLGKTYYIVVEAFAGTPGSYDLSFVDGTGGCNEDCDDGIDNDLDGLIDCADVDDCSTDPVCACDVDGDGHDAQGGTCGGDDCDDNDPLNFPTNLEVCDGQDNDCDGAIDEGVINTYYRDNDGDGYGTSAPSVTGCTQPAGYAPVSGDCDDGDSAVNPGATEVCNGIDDDCDGAIDDGAGDKDWFLDDDGDGFGTGAAVVDCAPPSPNHVEDDGDCDDTDASINPDAAEICNGIDDDCDGAPDDGLTFTDYYLDVDGDSWGQGAATNDCTPPPWDSTDKGGDCDDSDDSIYPGAPEICNGVDDDCDGSIDDGVSFQNYYDDVDGDSFGAGSPINDCQTPSPGWVTDDTDCVDTDAAINPAALEICNGIDDDCDGSIDDGLAFTDYYRDADGDSYGTGAATNDCQPPPGGYVDQNGDCNDGDVSIHPGAAEICDGIDQDCDGTADDGLPTMTWYRDLDNDTYGGAVSIDDCQQPVGYIDNTEDCDDTNDEINPDAQEICDGVDNDCDTLVDTDDPTLDASALGTWYLDGDLDGFGDPDVSQDSCTSVAGHVLNNDDCDDGDAAINPAADEICDGIDNDCDGAIDDSDPSVDLSTGTIWYHDADDDTFGSPGDTTTACDQPPAYTSDDTDCDDGTELRAPGLTEVCDGIDNDCDFILDEGTECSDDDGDGYSEEGGDCDDTDITIAPDATEICDGVDEDCDGEVDNNTECFDDDGDGFSENDGDCNDGDRVVSPSETEIADNGIDDDCDGSVDGGAYDPDGDGYTEEGGDCEPEDGTAYPGAIERPDGIDNDCDGDVDEGTTAADDDDDGFCEGHDLDGDGVDDCSDGSDPGDCNDTDDTVNPSSTDVENGIDDDCDGVIDNGTDRTDDDGDGFSEDEGDCDDDNDAVYPTADEEENGVDDDCDGLVDENWFDLDEDGWSTDEGDCNDSNGWMNPDILEQCGDGVDNNCDGVAEEGCRGLEATDTGLGNSGCTCTTNGSGPNPALWLLGLTVIGLRRTSRKEVN